MISYMQVHIIVQRFKQSVSYWQTTW